MNEYFNLSDLHIKYGDYVAIEAAPELKGTVIKTHIPLHGDITHDVEVSYKSSATWEHPEIMRLRDIPTRCLIKLINPLLEQ